MFLFLTLGADGVERGRLFGRDELDVWLADEGGLADFMKLAD